MWKESLADRVVGVASVRVLHFCGVRYGCSHSFVGIGLWIIVVFRTPEGLGTVGR